jgi:hypothetical protein
MSGACSGSGLALGESNLCFVIRNKIQLPHAFVSSGMASFLRLLKCSVLPEQVGLVGEGLGLSQRSYLKLYNSVAYTKWELQDGRLHITRHF